MWAFVWQTLSFYLQVEVAKFECFPDPMKYRKTFSTNDPSIQLAIRSCPHFGEKKIKTKIQFHCKLFPLISQFGIWLFRSNNQNLENEVSYFNYGFICNHRFNFCCELKSKYLFSAQLIKCFKGPGPSIWINGKDSKSKFQLVNVLLFPWYSTSYRQMKVLAVESLNKWKTYSLA